MSKKQISLFLILITVLFIKLPSLAYATSCSVSTYRDGKLEDPLIISKDMDHLPAGTKIEFKISSQGGFEPGKYDALLWEFWPFYEGWKSTERGPNGTLVTEDGNGLFNELSTYSNTKDIWAAGDHEIKVSRNGVGDYCKTYYHIRKTLPVNKALECNILGPKSPDGSSDIKLSGTVKPEGKYRFFIPFNKRESQFTVDSSYSISEQNLKQFNPGNYQVLLQKEGTVIDPDNNIIHPWENTNCLIRNLQIVPTDPSKPADLTPILISSSQPGAAITPIQVCTDDDAKNGICSSSGGKIFEGCNDPTKAGYDPTNPAIATAIGCIHTNPT
ncbi:MAG: hypothetical protein Q7S39_08560, partial [Ignavibacteria bacterium]|nr:hypothetical protein [Ignavibacteria bacterium]